MSTLRLHNHISVWAEEGEKRNAPLVFISYAYVSEEHNAWIYSLSERLRNDGINSIIDQYLPYGYDMASFMEKILQWPTLKHVICVCSSLYVQKATDGTGGVGYEKMIVTRELVQRANDDNKFIPILRDNLNGETPDFLGTRRYSDFRSDLAFEVQYNELRNDILGVRNIPPLGRRYDPDKECRFQFWEKMLRKKAIDLLETAVEERDCIVLYDELQRGENREEEFYVKVCDICYYGESLEYWRSLLKKLEDNGLVVLEESGRTCSCYGYTDLGSEFIEYLVKLRKKTNNVVNEEQKTTCSLKIIDESTATAAVEEVIPTIPMALEKGAGLQGENVCCNEQTEFRQAPLLGEQFILYFVTEDGEYDTFTVVNIAKNPYKSLYTLAEIQELLAKEYTSYATLERDLPDEITIQACDYSSFFELFSHAKLLSMTKNQGWQSIFQNAEQSIALHFQALHRLNQLKGINDGIVEKVWSVNQDDDIPF